MSEDRVVCTHCGAVNRLPTGKEATAAKCGGCGQLLFSGEPADVLGGRSGDPQDDVRSPGRIGITDVSAGLAVHVVGEAGLG